MNNAEKFKEVFGVEPDIDNCPLKCDNQDSESFRFSQCVNHCDRFKWWFQEYKEKR